MPVGGQIGKHDVTSFDSSHSGHRRRCRNHRLGRAFRGMREGGGKGSRDLDHHDHHNHHDATAGLSRPRRRRAESQRPEPVLALGRRTAGSDGRSRRSQARHAAVPGWRTGAGHRLLALIAAAGVLVLASDLRITPAHDAPALIGGPFALLLGASTDLGPSHRDDTQLTVALRDSAQPAQLGRLGARPRPVGAMAARPQLGRRRGRCREGGLRLRCRGARLPRPARSAVLCVPAAAVGARATASRGRRTRPDPELHPASHVAAADAAAGRAGSGVAAQRAAQHLQRAASWPRPASPARARPSWSSRSTASTRPTSTASRRCTNCRGSPPPWSAASPPSRAARRRWISRSRTPSRRTRGRWSSTPGRRSRATARLREDRADAGVGRPAVPRRGVELLDRLGLRQADHRRRSGAGAVRAGRRTRQRHNGFQRQRRPRGPGMQRRPRLVVAAE